MVLITIGLKGIFHAGKHVIDALATCHYKGGADNLHDEILRQTENFIKVTVVQSSAQDRCHRPGEGLHIGAEFDLEPGPAVLDSQEYPDSVYTLFVLADILNVEGLVFDRLPIACSEGEADKVLASLLLAEGLKY